MPSKPLKHCRVSGCSGLTSTGYCDKHAYLRKDIKANKQADPFYSSAAWKKARTRYRSKHPLCEICLAKGMTVRASLVDHIIEIKDGGARLDERNFQALCTACHGIKSAEAAARRKKSGL